MKRISLRMIALSLAGALVLSLGAGGVAYAEPGTLPPVNALGTNQELVDMLEQTNPKTYVAHDDIIITQPQFEEIGAKAREVTDGITDDFQKVVAIEDFVNRHITYSTNVADQNAYTAFTEKKGICQAYSNLTKAMLSYLGIPCVLVNGDSSGGGHAWNMAYTENEGWIFVDSTYSWDIVSTDVAEFSKSHQPYYCDSIQEKEGDYIFTYFNGVAVRDYLGNDTTLDIPDKFRDVSTTALDVDVRNWANADTFTSISFPATLKNIDKAVETFTRYTNLEEFQVAEGNPSFTSKDGVLFNSDMTQLLVYPAAKKDLSFQVPDTVTTLGECVFQQNANLKHVLISDKVDVPAKSGLFYDNSVTVYAPAGSAAATYAQQNGLIWKKPDEFPSPHAHTLTAVPAKASTCTVKGNIDYWYCTECDKYFSDDEGRFETTKDQIELPLAEHTEVTIPGKAATCTETGLTDGTKCSVCGEILVAQKEIPAKGHTDVTIPGKAATCTETGLTDGTKCSVCGEILVAQKEIPAKGHNYEDGVCTVCGAEDPDHVEPTDPVEPSQPVQPSQPVEPSEKPQGTVTLDNNTGYQITTGNADKVFDKNTVITVESVTGGNIYTTVEKALKGVVADMKDTAILEITATLDGKSVQPDGNVTITFQIPQHLSVDHLKLYYVAENGEKEEIAITVNKDARTATASLEHFSTYVLANVVVDEDGSKVPPTGDNSQVMVYASVLALAAAAFIIISAVAVKKRTR